MFRFSSDRRTAKRGGIKRARKSARRTQKIERLESRLALSSVPLNAQPLDTGEFMLGDVSVTVVFFESDGSVDPNTENWNPTHRNEVKQRIEEGLQWWVDTLALQSSVHELNFEIDYTYADNPVPTGVEPITHVANDFPLWVGDFLDHVGAERTDKIDNDVRLFNHSQRVANDTNWAFTIFVINAQNDADEFFPVNSTVRGAFSIAGGAFMAVPSRRPASTIAHEVSHQFWAMDEYAGSGHYEDTRGYYNTQNTNAVDGNPFPNTIETSLLGSSTPLIAAYNANTSSTESFESVGWKDSDGDGIFDVYDLPISFSATSQFDPASYQMRVSGNASIGVLPNQNSWGLQNSVTINRLSHVEYRLDGGQWFAGPVIDEYADDFDFLIQLPDADEHEIEVRVVDETGLIQSESLIASTLHIDSTDVHGFNGYITYDENDDGIFNAGEAGLAGWTVEVVDQAGNPQQTQTNIEPDDYPQNDIFYDKINGIKLIAEGSQIDPDFADVASRLSSISSTGTRGFYNYSGSSWSNVWSEKRQLKMTFDTPVSFVSIDAIAEVDGDIGILELYDASDNLLGRYTTSPMDAGESETMVVQLDSAQAAYAIARGHLTDTDDPRREPRYVGLDNLHVGRSHTITTDSFGAFSLPFDIDGNYRLKVTAPGGSGAYFAPLPETAVSLTPTGGTSRVAWSVSIADDSWHNPLMQADVNYDGSIDSSDFDLVLNELVSPQFTAGATQASRVLNAGHQSGGPYLDVNADGRFDKLDLLFVMDTIAMGSGSQQPLSPEPVAMTVYDTTPVTTVSRATTTALPPSVALAPVLIEAEPPRGPLPISVESSETVRRNDLDVTAEAPSAIDSLPTVILSSQDWAVIDSTNRDRELSATGKRLDDQAVDAILSDLDATIELL